MPYKKHGRHIITPPDDVYTRTYGVYVMASPVAGPAAAVPAPSLLLLLLPLLLLCRYSLLRKSTKRETVCCDGLCSAMHRGS